ncbi:MAG: hypothetical protein ACFFBD_01170 [Candidatus Hodarchaeota archaeon]
MSKIKWFGLLLLALSILVSLMAGITPALAGKDIILNVKIQDAYYCDADADGVEDDIIVTAQALFNGHKKVVHLRIYIEVVLPSGMKYGFIGETNCYSNGLYRWDFTMLNTATEAGWYTVNLYIQMNGSGTPVVVNDVMEFDPPDSKGGNGVPSCTLRSIQLK